MTRAYRLPLTVYRPAPGVAEERGAFPNSQGTPPAFPSTVSSVPAVNVLVPGDNDRDRKQDLGGVVGR